MTWVVIAALAIGSYALKITGPLLAGGRTPPAAFSRVIDLLTPALLTALIVVSTVGAGQQVVLDWRLAGVVVGAGLLLLRAPMIVALAAAAVLTAVLRLTTGVG